MINITNSGPLQHEIDYRLEGPNITFVCPLGYTMTPYVAPRVYDQDDLANLVLPHCAGTGLIIIIIIMSQ